MNQDKMLEELERTAEEIKKLTEEPLKTESPLENNIVQFVKAVTVPPDAEHAFYELENGNLVISASNFTKGPAKHIRYQRRLYRLASENDYLAVYMPVGFQ